MRAEGRHPPRVPRPTGRRTRAPPSGCGIVDVTRFSSRHPAKCSAFSRSAIWSAGMGKRQGGGKRSKEGNVPAPLVALAGACGVAAMLYKPLLALLPGPESTVEICNFGRDADLKSIEELMQRSTPCIVRGLQPELHAALTRQLSPAALKALPASELFLRVSEGGSHSRILQHSNTAAKEKNFFDEALQLTWPTGPYDGWTFKKTTVNELLNPPRDYSASFVQDVRRLSHCGLGSALLANCLLVCCGGICRYLVSTKSCPRSSKQRQRLLMPYARTTVQRASSSGGQFGSSRGVSASKCTPMHRPTCCSTCMAIDRSFSRPPMKC